MIRSDAAGEETLAIPSALRGLLDRALTAVWSGIGPGAREVLRELQCSLPQVAEHEARELLRDVLHELAREVEQAQRDPDILVYAHMPAAAADRLIAERSERGSVIADRVLLAHQDPKSLAEITVALNATTVGAAHRERLSGGLAALREPGETWSVPCDLLLGGLEGLIWELAESSELTSVDPEGMLLDRSGRVLRSVNAALRPEAGLELSAHVRQFLDRRFFAGEGHSVRHRRHVERQREWTAYALVALRGLLDDLGSHRLIRALAGRLADEAKDTGRGAEAPLGPLSARIGRSAQGPSGRTATQTSRRPEPRSRDLVHPDRDRLRPLAGRP
jgi:hypothetical protein